MLTIFTDTDSSITPSLAEELGIKVISMPYIMDDKIIYTYKDFIDFDYKAFYDRLRSGYVPKTAALNVNEYVEYFEPEFKAGNEVLYIHFSKEMSGSFNAMNTALEILKETYPNYKFVEVDTKCISVGQLLMVKDMAEMYKNGASLEELKEYGEKYALNYSMYLFADDLLFFKRSGRVSGIAAIAGTILGLKPIIYLNNAGKMVAKDKVRGTKAALDYLFNKIVSSGLDVKKHGIIIGHCDCLDSAHYLSNKLKDQYGEDLNIITIVVDPTVGSHCGPGALGVGFYCSTRE